MTIDPWMIEQLEEEARRREEEDARAQRIELPQTRPLDRSEEAKDTRVAIVDFSPLGGATFDL